MVKKKKRPQFKICLEALKKFGMALLLLKLPNKGKERIFLKYSFHSIPFHFFPSPKYSVSK
jgi:hypothetical protein